MERKSILVIDTPKNCPDCQLMVDGWCYGIPSKEEVQGKIKYLKRPSWCPLRPLPCKKYMRQIPSDVLEMGKRKRDFIIHKVDVDNSYAEGWNDCLAEIIGETE